MDKTTKVSVDSRTVHQIAAEYCLRFGREKILQYEMEDGEVDFLKESAKGLGIPTTALDRMIRKLLYPSRYEATPDSDTVDLLSLVRLAPVPHSRG